MNEFISRFQSQLRGVLSGFDRLVFRGQLALNHEAGMKGYLWANGVAWKHYASHVAEVSQRVKQASVQAMAAAHRPVQYLTSAKESKEELARAIAQRDGILSGPVCAFTSVEPDLTWHVKGDHQTKKLRLLHTMRPCLHVYHYWSDPVFGFMSARLQTWFPFTIYVYLNGRQWLARQMDQAAIRYRQHDNCFSWIEDFPRAQTLMEEQLKTDWSAMLDRCAQRIHPLFTQLFSNYPVQYYWTAFQSEWATDFVFADPQQLRRLFPQLVHLAMVGFSCPDVMRFLDKKISSKGKTFGKNNHEVVSDHKLRTEGVRVKHRHGKNSIKMYDKAYSDCGAVLRAEVTVNAPEQFRVYRHKTGHSDGPMQWQPLRRGVADLHRRAEVSQKALDRYSTALASVDDTTTLQELTASIEIRILWQGRSVRALHPFQSTDRQLLTAVNRGEFTINGMRNRDLQVLLFPDAAADPTVVRRRSAAISRKLRMLRAHGIIQKLPHTHRYQVTAQGRLILNALTSAQRTTTQQLTTLTAA